MAKIDINKEVKKNTKTKKRLLVEIMLSLVVLVAAVVYCYQTPLKTVLQLVLTLKVSHHEKDTFKILTRAHSIETRIAATGNFEEVHFALPRGEIDNLDILLGLTPGMITIKSVKLEGSIFSYTIEGKRLKTLFQVNPSTAKYYLRKNNFCIHTTEILHWLRVNKSFIAALHRLQVDKLIFYLLSVLMALVFFYLVHFVDFRVLKIFFNRHVFLGGLWIWLLILYFPIVDDALKIITHDELVEQRLMNKKPVLRFDAVPEYLKNYTAFYNDFFAPRSELIYMNSFLKLKLFGTPSTEKVLVGKNQWLFFHRKSNQPSTVDYYRNLYPFTEPELHAWKKLLEARQKWCAARGIDYLFFLVPNKNTIYSEYMPDYIQKIRPDSRMDQLLDYLKKHSTIHTLDIRPALLAAKKQYPVFYKTDTHWNDYGAFVGHQELIKYMAAHFRPYKDAKPLPFSFLKIRSRNIIGGDLAIMMSLQHEVLREDNIEIFPHTRWSFTGDKLEDIEPFVEQGFTENPHAHLPNILMVHDSFYRQIKPYLSELITRCLYIWDWGMHFFPTIIEREKPALVIDEMVERFLLNKVPDNPKELLLK